MDSDHRDIVERLALTDKRIERLTFLASCAVHPTTRLQLERALAALEEERRRWMTARRDAPP